MTVTGIGAWRPETCTQCLIQGEIYDTTQVLDGQDKEVISI